MNNILQGTNQNKNMGLNQGINKKEQGEELSIEEIIIILITKKKKNK